MDGAEARRILDEYFPRKRRFVGGNYSTSKYNILGFGSEDVIEYKHCPIDIGIRLIKTKRGLSCPTCGYIYKKEDAPNEESINIKHKQQKPMIVSAKKTKKYYSKDGNLITDETLIQDIQQGANVISYHEQNQYENSTIDKANKRIIRD